MPIVSKSTLTLSSPGRIHLDKVYKSMDELSADATLTVTNPQAFQKEEQNRSALYLRTLSHMLADRGLDFNAEHLYANPVDDSFSFGSQAHLVVADCKPFYQSVHNDLGPSESTTRYGSFYNAINRDFAAPAGKRVVSSFFALDERARDVLEKNQVPRESLKKFGEGFLFLADLSDHGYLHHLSDLKTGSAKGYLEFVEPGKSANPAIEAKRAGKTSGGAKEDFLLALHAQIMKEVFKDFPKRKELVLARAAQSFEQLAEMQDKALACCPFWERTAVKEAITYFAELTAHRLFRIFSPDDPALKQATTAGRSVADSMAELKLLTPKKLRDRIPEAKNATGLEQLRINCTDWLGDTYRAIHTQDSFPVSLIQNVRDPQPVILELTALQVLAMFSIAAARSMPDPGKHLSDSKTASHHMRKAAKLRKDGQGHQANLLEARLRGTDTAPSTGERAK